MAATQVARPFHRDGWICDRLQGRASVRLVSRNGRDLTKRFAELAAAVVQFSAPAPLLLDGEVAVFDTKPISRFEWLRGRPKDETATRRC